MTEFIQPILIVGLSLVAIKLCLDNRRIRSRFKIEDDIYPEITTWDQDLSDQIEYAYNVKVYGEDVWDEISLLRRNIEDLKKNKYKYTGISDGKDVSDCGWERKPRIIKIDLFDVSGYQGTKANSVRIVKEHKPNYRYDITETGYRTMIDYTERHIADLFTRSRLGL